jgi:hypothetical protein
MCLWGQRHGPGIDDTLRTDGAGHTQHRTVKVVSGGSATALPRSLERSLRELKNAGGDTGDVRD